MKHLLSLFIIIAVAALPFTLQAQAPVVLHDSLDQQIFPLSKLAYYQDYTHKLSLEEVSAPDFQQRFKLNPGYTSKDFNDEAVYWVKMQIRHNPASVKKWMLEFYDQRLDEIQAYIPDQYGYYHLYQAGDRQLFKERQLQHKNFEFMLDNSANQERTYYFRIKSQGSADIRIALRSLNWFVYYALNEYLLFGIFYGMVLIICLYNSLMYTAFRESKYLIYVAYLVSLAVYVMSIDGLAFQYLWPAQPALNQIAYGVAEFSMVVWALRFTQKFINTRHRFPIADNLIWTTIIARSLYFLICLVVDPQLFEYGLVEVVPLSVMLGVSIFALQQGYRPARFIVAAYSILFLGFVLKVLTNLGLLPFSIVLNYSLRFSFFLEMLLLSFALADQVRILKDKKEKAQRRIIKQMTQNVALKEVVNKELAEKMALKEKVNQELEQKVLERTQELQQNNQKLELANQKLTDQAREIHQINSMLDLDNWKLKNSLRKELNDRLLNKNLDYAEFQKLYPDEKTCLRYLDKLKQGIPFHCKKCSNTKCTESNKVYAKRCTRCGKSESVTAYTLFHGVKFPIEKAFYLGYITINGHAHFTLDELAALLNLRRNTIWGFKQKAQLVIDYQQQRKKGKPVHWEEMVLSCPSTLTKQQKPAPLQPQA